VGGVASERPDEQQTLKNFGGNQTWTARCQRPQDERALLDILRGTRQGQLRPLGSGHSWSDVAVTHDIALDMSAFDAVRTFERDGEMFAEVGAGCRLQELLDRLHATTDRTLPTVGAIKRQTVSGAISTGTHGSGKPSLSHFVTAVRLATYDRHSGEPQIVEYRGGNVLKAARCALGCMGVLLTVEVRTVAKYLVEETVRPHASLDDLLKVYAEHPLTQFILVPHGWGFVAWERKAVDMRPLRLVDRLKAWFFRLYGIVWIDVAFHLLLKTAVVIGAPAVKLLFRLLPYLLLKKLTRIDHAEHVLTLGHYYFQHEEMELFVPESRLREAVELLRAATAVFAGDTVSVPEEIETRLTLHKLHGDLIRNTGTYVQHYPFFFRRVEPDDTLISMTSGAKEPYYSVSVFTYLAPGQRQHYYVYCAWLARAMNRLFGTRLHWGKHFPLGALEIARLYPELERFRQLCGEVDPNGVFRNDYTKRVLGL
jgi:L-gulono-1,4-lactone dehydrogenase